MKYSAKTFQLSIIFMTPVNGPNHRPIPRLLNRVKAREDFRLQLLEENKSNKA